MRPSTISSFALGLAVGVVAVTAAATFTTAGSGHLPDCQTPAAVHYATALKP